MTKTRLATYRLALAGCVLLVSACSGSQSAMDEKIQRAEQAAERAEEAQKRAEAAAQKSVTFASHAGINDEKVPDAPSAAERNMEKASQDPNSPYFDNNVG